MVVHKSEIVWPSIGHPQRKYQIQLTHHQRDEDEGHNLDLEAKCGNEVVGFVRGSLLQRPSRYFFELADEISAELQGLSCLFCESNGVASRVKHPLLVQDPAAVYGGGFLHIDIIEVNPSHQGFDLGLRILHELFVLLRDQWTLAVAIPSGLGRRIYKWSGNSREPWPEERDATEQQREILAGYDDKVKRHFARLGFVQAGRKSGELSAWFLTSTMYFSNSSSPPSDAIARWRSKSEVQSMEIFKEVKKRVPTGVDKELREFVACIRDPRDPRSSINVAALMIEQVAQVNPGDQEERKREDIEAIEGLVARGASIHGSRALFAAAALRMDDPYPLRALVRLGGDVNLSDEKGNRPLHVAAACMNHNAVKFLVETAQADPLAANQDGDTPMKCLQDASQNWGDFTAAMGMQLPPREIDVVPKLNTITALTPPSMRAPLIEPRMRLVLEITAENEASFLEDSDCSFVPFKPLALSECCGVLCGIPRIDYIPADVLLQHPEGLYKSFHDGWGYIWSAMLKVLQERKVPTVQRIQEYLESGRLPEYEFDYRKYRHFLDKGGKIEHGVDALIAISRNVVKNGDDGWEYVTFQNDIEALPATPLDDAFDIAWFMCINRGGGELTTCGPYRDTYMISQRDEVDDEMDDGDY